MAEPTGARRLRSSGSKVRAEAAKEIGKRTTTSQHKIPGNREYSPEVTEHELFAPRVFGPGQEAAFVRVSAGGTYNLGSFESLRLDVSITMPCLPEEVDRAVTEISSLVSDKLEEEERQWLGNRK